MSCPSRSLLLRVNSPPVATRPALLASIQTRLAALTPPRPPPPPAAPVVELDTDILVAGGGLAGVCAALAAARQGARVVLVQDRSRLGGNSSSEVRMHVVGANWHKNRPGWREGGLLEEIRLDDAVNNPQRCRELWDVLLYDKVVSEPNLTLLLDSVLHGVELAAGRITHALVRCEAAERAYRIRARLSATARATPAWPSRRGRNSGAAARHGPNSANRWRRTGPTARCWAAASCSRPGTTGGRCPLSRPSGRGASREQLRRRTIKSWEYGYWWIEWGGHLDTIADHPRIRHELMAIALGIWDYIKNSGEVPARPTGRWSGSAWCPANGRAGGSSAITS
jgi:hypothetical protein